MSASLVDQIDALLPQTQCGLCTHGGCLPYARAIALQGESIDKCPPGGMQTLQQLSALTGIAISVEMETQMRAKQKSPLTAVVREAECIGCTKCIQACPVDAIVGAAKRMHTVITAECTGCELCVAPCPVDCIDMLPAEQAHDPALARKRFTAREARLEAQKVKQAEEREAQKRALAKARKRREIAAAVARAKAKKEMGHEQT